MNQQQKNTGRINDTFMQEFEFNVDEPVINNTTMNWYSCKSCGAVQKKASMPSILGCPGKKENHRWILIGEEGKLCYRCNHCKINVQTNSTPQDKGCSESLYHDWIRILK